MRHIRGRRAILAAMLSALTSGACAQGAGGPAPPSPAVTVIRVDAAADRHPISPLIYGVNFGSKAQLRALNCPLDRQGGNNFTCYNWQNNTVNIDADYYFESIPGFFLGQPTSLVPGQRADSFIADCRAAGAQPMVTIPMMGWVARVTDPHKTLSSFSVAKYGPQQKTAAEDPDAGNGVKPDGTDVTGNDPNDAQTPSTPAFQKGYVRHLVGKWGASAHGGVRYYLMDNEPSLWDSTHRDVHPQGETMDEYLHDFLAYATMVRSVDPGATICGPEEWGWPGYFQSGADQQYARAHHYQGHPDRDAHGGMDYLPWLLSQLHRHDLKTGRRLLDVLTVHIYPQGGDGGGDASPKVQALRDRSTRALWDPRYKDESWINDTVMLIPRLKQWVAQYYPGTKVGITEYDWGAEGDIGGATAQADVLGIFGREGLDLACRWTAPGLTTPTFQAMRMYRDYDGHDAGFGGVGVSDVAPDPDALSSFASVRRRDGALTVMVVNKESAGPAPITVALSHFRAGRSAQAWQLTSAGVIARLPDVAVSGGRLSATVPAQSVTLLVIPRDAR